MTFLDIYPHTPTSSSRLRRLHSFALYFTISGMFTSTTLSAMYVYQGYGTTRFSYVLETCALAFGAVEAIGAFLNMKWKMEKAAEVQSKFQAIADQGKLNFGFKIPKSRLYIFWCFPLNFQSCRAKCIVNHVLGCREEMLPSHQNHRCLYAIRTSFILNCIAAFNLLSLYWKFWYVHVLFAIAYSGAVQHRLSA